MRTNVYIDGFNFYYRAVKGTPYKWLNVRAMLSAMLPRDSIKRIRYFTAPITPRPNDLLAPQRQQVYLRALETLPGLSIHYGNFLTNATSMPLVHPAPGGPLTAEVWKTEERAPTSTWRRGSYAMRLTVISSSRSLCPTTPILLSQFRWSEINSIAKSESSAPRRRRLSVYNRRQRFILRFM